MEGAQSSSAPESQAAVSAEGGRAEAVDSYCPALELGCVASEPHNPQCPQQSVAQTASERHPVFGWPWT